MVEKEEIKGVEIYSEEIQAIMGNIPGRLLRWGGSVIFILIIIVFVGSYFFSFNEIVKAPMIITTTNPPAPLIAKSSGRIIKWYVNEGDTVSTGDKIALIENPAQMNDIDTLEQIISAIELSNLKESVSQIDMPNSLFLGDLQDQYNQILNNWNNYKTYIADSFLLKKIEMQKQEGIRQKEYQKIMYQQKTLVESEYMLAEKKYKRDVALGKVGGIPEADLEDSKLSFIQSKRTYSSFQGSLQSVNINVINQERSLLELEEQYKKDIFQFESSIENNLSSLRVGIKRWRESYLLISPIDGIVTLTKFWSENHVITLGERLATIVPSGRQSIICRANVSSSDIGKIQIGQKVNLKLAGFPFMQYGIVNAFVVSISLVPEDGSYIVEIALKQDEGVHSTYKEQLKFVQEMDGTAEIVTQESRFIFRFIKPLKISFKSKQVQN